MVHRPLGVARSPGGRFAINVQAFAARRFAPPGELPTSRLSEFVGVLVSADGRGTIGLSHPARRSATASGSGR